MIVLMETLIAYSVNRRFCRDMLTRIPSSVFSGCLRRRVEGEFDRVVGRSAVSRRSLPHPLSAPIQAGAFIYPRRGKRLFFFFLSRTESVPRTDRCR